MSMLHKPSLVLPGPVASRPKRGMELVDLMALGIIPGLSGSDGAHGIHAAGDIVTQTADGRDLNVIWNDFMELLNAVNGERQALVNFLTFPVTQPVEMVAQPGQGVDFEEASEFGEPTGARIQPEYFNMAYGFKWYDLAARYSWQYVAEATSTMLDSIANAAVEAYNRKQMHEVLKTVFNKTNLVATIRQQPYTVYKFYNNDGTVPPTYKTNTFLGTHDHYKVSGGAVIDAGDLDLMIDDFESHGYTQTGGYQTVVMMHKTEADTVRGFRSVANGGAGKYDFLPAQGQPGQIMAVNQQLVGQGPVANTLRGLNVIGSYGTALIVQEDWLPVGYVFGFCTGGTASLSNPVGLREHANAGLRGLRLVKGRTPNYPLLDSFWTVGFGTGIRHRGAGMVMQIKASGTYDIPAVYA